MRRLAKKWFSARANGWMPLMGGVILAALTVTGYAEDAAEQTLLKFGPGGYPLSEIRCEDAKVSALKPGGLLVRLGKEIRWPAIVLEGTWDLSNDAWINFDVANRGPKPVSLEVLLYDDPRRDWKKAIFGREYLAPGEAKVITLQLVRKGQPGDALILSGMNGIPEGIPALRGLDMQRVRMITLSKTQNHSVDTLEVRRIYVSGTYEPKNLKAMLPLVDRFGQYRHAEWPGKIHREEELQSSMEREVADLAAHPEPSERDRFGGWSGGPQLTATGRFHPEKYHGKWQLVDPDGRLFFSLGVNHVNVGGGGSYTPVTAERKLWFESLPSPNDWNANGRFYNVRQIYTGDYSGRMEPGFSFLAWNLARKYGKAWENAGRELAHRRLRSWGYNTLANWSDVPIEAMERTPFTLGTALAGSGCRVLGGGKWSVGKVWDPYDPGFVEAVDRAISGLKKLGSSPWCIGIFFDNELYWDEEFGETALRSDAAQPARQMLLRDLREKYNDIAALNAAWRTSFESWEALQGHTAPIDLAFAKADLEAFYLKTAEAYFQTIRDSIHRQIPGCLYLGPRFARITPLAYEAAAKYCDIVSINLYRRDLKGYQPPAKADAPLLISEFHFGATDRGMWGSGLVPVKSQAERAQALRAYLDSALRHPQIVGCHWFEYYDQPLTGRSFDGENYAHGLLSGADVPYAEMVEAARDISETMYRVRADANPGEVPE